MENLGFLRTLFNGLFGFPNITNVGSKVDVQFIKVTSTIVWMIKNELDLLGDYSQSFGK